MIDPPGTKTEKVPSVWTPIIFKHLLLLNVKENSSIYTKQGGTFVNKAAPRLIIM